jgi:peptidoglycan/LPS O-acetylase OafA/YrhL
MVFVSNKPTFGFLSDIGWAGVDLFFVLSGYLIGNQIFSPYAHQRIFSLKIFYYRRLLRTLPNYLVILAIYFLIPGFKEKELTTPLWKFLTFTQNFDLKGGAFSHAWSLCVEEQFYLILPALTLFFAYSKSLRNAWLLILGILIAGIILRSSLWIYYLQNAKENFNTLYYNKIYYSSFCRLDELVLGVSIALLRNFHKDAWKKMTDKGNLILLFGCIGSAISFYLFIQFHYSFLMTAVGYPLLAISFAALTLAALSPTSYLHRIKIPGAASLAIWSYAIYLVHKPLIVIVNSMLSKWGISQSSSFTVVIAIFVSIFGGWVLYTCIEAPFLNLRDKVAKTRSIPTTGNQLVTN